MFDLDGAVKYHFGKFPPQGMNYSLLAESLVNAADALARYDQMLKNMHNSEILLAPLRNQEAVISSRMEGTISTMDEILAYEADYEEGEENFSNAKSEVIETILYRRTLKNAQEAIEEGYPISQFLIKTMHQQLLSFGRGAAKSPGKFKTNQNYLADKYKQKILFVPISPELLQTGLDALFNYINNSSDITLIRTAVTHLEFEALHPFEDGNGRIGRILITLMLWASKAISKPHFYLSGYLEENKDLYISTMRQVSEDGNWDNWCIFFLNAVEQQAKRNLIIAENISQLYENMKEEFAKILSSKWSVKALDFVFTYPVFRNSKFTSTSGIPSGTAARFTRELVSKNILHTRQEASGRRPAMYSFEKLMELVRV